MEFDLKNLIRSSLPPVHFIGPCPHFFSRSLSITCSLQLYRRVHLFSWASEGFFFMGGGNSIFFKGSQKEYSGGKGRNGET